MIGANALSSPALPATAGIAASVAADAVLDPVEQAVPGRVVGAVERLLERERVGRAVALEHQAAQAEQRRAVVAPVVDARLEAVQHRQRGERGQLGERVARELLLDELGQHRRQPFGGLEHDVADEAVADDDVGRALEDVVGLDVAVEIDDAGGGRGAQQLARLLDRLAALDRLFADVEQADRRLGLARDRRTRARCP